jgi:general secretion pathway protein D
VSKLFVLLMLAVVIGGCAAGRAFRRGDAAMRSGDLDAAVAYFRTAVQADPENPGYKIALERAMQNASRAHFERARQFEAQDQLEAARGEYRLAAEYDATNRQAAAKVALLDQTIRDRIEAARPRPAIEEMRERARAAAQPPLLNPASREPLNLTFTNARIGDIINAIADAHGISVTYDREVQVDRAASIRLVGVTLEEGLTQLFMTNQLSYKVTSPRSILVFPDTPPKHTQYDDQVIQTFYISHADVTDLSQLISAIIRLPGIAVQPAIQFNKTANAITVRGTASLVSIVERIIQQNDKPRAEIVFDVEILEVDRARVKQYGLNLSEFAIGGIFSPEVSPVSTTTATPGTGTPPATGTPTTGTTTTNTGRSTAPGGVTSPPAFNLNTITRGVNTSDFYLAVPTAIVRFLESDTNTRIVAKPQLRGAEGSKLTLNLGDEIPIVSTSYTPIATGGVGVNPLNSFQLKPVGINIDITPRVTLEGDIIVTLNVESSSRGTDVNVAGTNYPSFGSRKVSTVLRLRDGESNLMAGLLREDERRSLQGFPGAIHLPILRQLFSSNDSNILQTDIVMLLTPHIVRTHGITEDDLRPIYIGSQANLGLGGPPPLIGADQPPAGVPAAAAGTPATPGTIGAAPATPGASTPRPPAAAPGAPPTGQQPQTPPGTIVAPPPGSSPVPGTMVVPSPSAAPPAAAPTTPEPDAPPPAGAAAAPTAPPATTVPPPAPGAAAAAAATPGASPGVGAAQIILTPPGTTFRVGGGPYTVPISITNAARVSTVTLTLLYDPAVLRVRAVNEGSFMRAGGANATFTQEPTPGRVDITIARSSDATGASGTGLLAAVLFDAIGAGSATLTISGMATGPGGTPMGLRFQPVTVTVQ